MKSVVEAADHASSATSVPIEFSTSSRFLQHIIPFRPCPCKPRVV